MTHIRLMELIDSGELGGGQIHVASLLRNIDYSAFDVTVCAGPRSPLTRLLEGIGCDIVPVDVKAVMSPSSFIRVVRELKRRRIDLVHVHGGVAGMWGRLAAALARTPRCVYTCHGLHFFYKENPVARWAVMGIERALSRFNDGLIYVSEHDRGLGTSSGVLAGRRVRVIRNGIDPRKYRRVSDPRAKRVELGIPQDAPVFGSVGRLHPQKGHIVLLEAMRKLAQEHPEARLLLIGDGPLRPELEERVARWGLGERVRFLGYRHDVPELLEAIDLFVLSSYWEGLPISLLEAMASGTPVAAPKIGGVTEVVDDGKTGYLFPAGNHEELYRLMSKFIELRDGFMAAAEQAREKIASCFTVDRMARETMEFLMEIYREGGDRGGHEGRARP